MSVPRFYLPAPLATGDEFEVPDQVARHMVSVLRLKAGDAVTLFNGEGGEFQGQLQAVTKKSAVVALNTHDPVDRAPALAVHLGMCVIKRDNMDLVVAKATELGIAQLTPLVSEYCTVARKVIRNREDHWRQVAITACEQCGLNRVPAINPALDIRDWTGGDRSATRLVCHPGGRRVAGITPGNPVDLLVGPEGGLTDEEVTSAERSGFEPVSFGERILRAETAPVVAMSVLHDRWSY